MSLYFLFLFFFPFSTSETIFVTNVPNTTLSVSTASSTAISVQNLPNSNGIGSQSLSVSITQATKPVYADVDKITAYGPIPVIIQIALIDVQKIDGVEQVFGTDFYMQAFWPDATVCKDSNPSNCLFDSNNMWNPSIEFVNLRGSLQRTVSNPYSIGAAPKILNNVVNGSNILSNWGNVWVTLDQRFSGTFSTKLFLQDFPYDKQDVQIFIESSLYDNKTVQFIFPSTIAQVFVSSDFYINEWVLRAPVCDFSINNYYYPIFAASYSRASAFLHLRRIPDYYINKIVVGVIFLILMNICVFSLDVEESDRMMGTISIFLALVAYLFVESADVPKIAYQTKIDSFMNISFYFVFFSMVAHAIFYLLNEIYGEGGLTNIRDSAKNMEPQDLEKKCCSWRNISWQRKLDIVFCTFSASIYFIVIGVIFFATQDN